MVADKFTMVSILEGVKRRMLSSGGFVGAVFFGVIFVFVGFLAILNDNRIGGLILISIGIGSVVYLGLTEEKDFRRVVTAMSSAISILAGIPAGGAAAAMVIGLLLAVFGFIVILNGSWITGLVLLLFGIVFFYSGIWADKKGF